MTTTEYLERLAANIAGAVRQAVAGGRSISSIAASARISRTTLYSRLDEPTTFTVPELTRLCVCLGINDVDDVFPERDAA